MRMSHDVVPLLLTESDLEEYNVFLLRTCANNFHMLLRSCMCTRAAGVSTWLTPVRLIALFVSFLVHAIV